MKQTSDTGASGPGIRCHVCAEADVDMLEGYQTFRRVTSDCKLWHRGGRLGVCRACGCAQKAIDPIWEAEVQEIYRLYSVYHQGAGVEQSVFEENSGRVVPRSARLLERVRSNARLPETGRLLDIGCGNGALLRAFGGIAPSWSLVGTELDDKHRQEVERLAGVEAMCTCPPHQVPGVFNLITMIHVLEHIPAPREFLAKLRDKLELGGLLVIEVPDYLQNPFDLLIADHSTHFSAATVSQTVEKAGYEIVTVADDWVPKELTVVARKNSPPQQQAAAAQALALDALRCRLRWLETVLAEARRLSKTDSFGLFGTSIAATWLFGELEARAAFFVDEDPQRAGRMYMERPVYRLGEVPPGSHVLVVMPANQAEKLKARLEALSPSCQFFLPPAFPTQDTPIGVSTE